MQASVSYWISSTQTPGYPKLDRNLTVPVPVAVVGGGIAGLTAALLLKQAGYAVAVLEAAEIGSGATGHTTGKVTRGQGLVYSRLESSHGEETAKAYAASQVAGLEYPVDGLPYVGRVRPGIFVATGFAGWGLSNGTFAGVLPRDAILGRANELAALFGPGRSSLRRGSGAFVKDGANVAKELVLGKLKRQPGDIADVLPGSGEVLTVDGRKAAVYRDDGGAVHAVSAVCTHMGCDVASNEAERRWGCPCHGSRFSTAGEVLEGPATRPLAPVDVAAGSRVA